MPSITWNLRARFPVIAIWYETDSMIWRWWMKSLIVYLRAQRLWYCESLRHTIRHTKALNRAERPTQQGKSLVLALLSIRRNNHINKTNEDAQSHSSNHGIRLLRRQILSANFWSKNRFFSTTVYLLFPNFQSRRLNTKIYLNRKIFSVCSCLFCFYI